MYPMINYETADDNVVLYVCCTDYKLHIVLLYFHAGKNHLKRTCGRGYQVTFLKIYIFQRHRLITQGIVACCTDFLHVAPIVYDEVDL